MHAGTMYTHMHTCTSPHPHCTHTQACTCTGTQRLLTGVQLDDVGGFGDDHVTQFAAQGLGWHRHKVLQLCRPAKHNTLQPPPRCTAWSQHTATRTLRNMHVHACRKTATHTKSHPALGQFQSSSRTLKTTPNLKLSHFYQCSVLP